MEQSLESALKNFKSYWKNQPENQENDRDSHALMHACTKSIGHKIMTPIHHKNILGGGLCRITTGEIRPQREDVSYYNPIMNYVYLAGWRIAIPQIISDSTIRALLYRIYQYGPGAAGYIQLGNTLIPAPATEIRYNYS